MMLLGHVQPEVPTPGRIGPRATSLPCELHSHSRDVFPLYREQHHIVPQDWQHEFRPAKDALVPGPADRPGELWDKRTVNICRTGHGNVHFLLVMFMKEREKLGDSMIDDTIGVHRIRIKVVESLRDDLDQRVNSLEAGVAEMAMRRWVEYGLSLMDLCRNGSYGRI